MKKILVCFVLLSISFMSLCAKSISRKDALEYFKNKSNRLRSEILMTISQGVHQNPYFILAEKYYSIQFIGKDLSNLDFPYLSAFPEIEHLTFCDAGGLKDIHLKYISNFPNLRYLDFEDTRITGSGFRYMKNLPRLEEIDLTGTRVSDKTIQYLKKFKSLRFIGLCKTKVTKRGIARLQKYLPNCDIIKECENDGNQE